MATLPAAMTASNIPALEWDSSILPLDQQFAAHQRLMAHFDISTPHPELGFPARATAWQLGPIIVNLSTIDVITVRRTAGMVRSDSVDHYVLVLLVNPGNWEGDFAGRSIRIESGEICLFDMTQPMVSRSDASTTIILMIPRTFLDEVLPPFDMHGLTVEGATGRLLADYLKSLVARLPTIRSEDGTAIARATRDLIAATVGTVRTPPPAKASSALLLRAKRHISAHLGTDLSAANLCRALSTSRSSLFRAFEPLGGLESYVQQRRLARAHELLARPDEDRTVAEIGFSVGFKTSAHFSRAFRETYGYPPGSVLDTRVRPVTDPRTGGDVHAAYSEWGKSLR